MEQMCIDRERCRRAAWLFGAFAAFLPVSAALGDADVDQAKPQAAAIGQFITLDGTIDDAAIGRVKRMGLALQNRAQQEGRKGVLVLEITKGTSQFHNVQGLANFLSKDLPGLRKVAWIPQDVSGNNVVAALACNDIVMHPDAALGNIGLGKPLDPDEQNFVVNLVNRRHNNKLSSALAMGMTDPQVEVIQVQIQTGEPPNDATETRLVLPGEFERLQRVERVAIPQHETVKNPGRAGTFTGSQAAHGGYLVSAVAQDKSDVAELYGLPRQAMREDPAGGDAPVVRVIRIDDIIESVLQGFVVRHIEQAVAEGANLIIFEIDSPGGVLLAGQEIAHTIADLDSQKVRTIAYIPHEAISAAALISLGCDEIYMHPDAKIGDIGVIARQGPNAEFQFIPEKLLTVLKEDAKDLARKKNRPEALALSMIIKETEVYQVKHRDTGRVWYMTEDEIHAKGDEWIKGAIVPETRNNMFLTINGERAEELLIAEAAGGRSGGVARTAFDSARGFVRGGRPDMGRLAGICTQRAWYQIAADRVGHYWCVHRIACPQRTLRHRCGGLFCIVFLGQLFGRHRRLVGGRTLLVRNHLHRDRVVCDPRLNGLWRFRRTVDDCLADFSQPDLCHSAILDGLQNPGTLRDLASRCHCRRSGDCCGAESVFAQNAAVRPIGPHASRR